MNHTPFNKFVEAYQSMQMLEEKLSYLKEQFAFDPLNYDLGHTQVNQAAISLQAHMVNSLNFEQFEFIIYALQDILKNYLSQGSSEDSRQSCRVSDILTLLAPIQSLIILSLAKCYTQLLISEFFDSQNYDAERVYIMQNAFDIIGELASFLITHYAGKLKPGFRPQLQLKIQDCLTILQNHNERELFNRTLSSINTKKNNNIDKKKVLNRFLSSEDDSRNTLVPESQRAVISATRPSQPEMFKYKKIAFGSERQSQNQQMQNQVGSGLQTQQASGQTQGSQNFNETDKKAIESLFYSLIQISNSLLQEAQNSKQPNQIESLLNSQFIPIMLLVKQYELIFFDSFQNLQMKRRIIGGDNYEFNLLMHDVHTAAPFQNYSLITLLLRSFLKANKVMQTHQIQYQQSQIVFDKIRHSKNVSISSKNEFQHQSITNSASLLKKNDITAKIIDDITQRQIIYYLVHYDLGRQQHKRQEEEQKKSQIIIEEQKKIAQPTLKRQKTVGLLSIRTQSLNSSIANDPLLSSNKLRQIRSPLNNPLNDIQSPSVFIKNLVGLGNTQDDVTPSETVSREPLRIERITDEGTSKIFSREMAAKKTVDNQLKQNDQPDPIQVLRQPQSYRDHFKSSDLIHSSEALINLSEARINWIRVSHTLMELQIETLKQQFGLDRENIKVQFLFDRMFDLLKITLYFICQFKHHQELFYRIDDLQEIADTELYPCFLANTFQIVRIQFLIFTNQMMTITQGDNQHLQETFYDEYLDIITLLSIGLYDDVDKNFMLKIYYNLFFEKICQRGTPKQLFMTIPHLLNFFNSFCKFQLINHYIIVYPQKRIKDVEAIDYLRQKKNYKILYKKLMALDQTSRQTVSTPQTNTNRIKPDVEVNMILFQQLVLGTISLLAHYNQKKNDLCWREIETIINFNYSTELNQAKLYQYLKLVLLIMRSQQAPNNQEIFTILMDENDKDLLLERKFWSLAASSKDENFNKSIWESIIQKLRSYLKFQYDKQQKKQNEQAQNNNNNNQNQQLREEIQQLIARNLSVIQPDNRQGGAGANADVISEGVFNMYKRFLMYGIQNNDICNQLYKLLLEFVRDIMDILDLNSYDLALVITKHILISKDKTRDQDEVLIILSEILKRLNPFINHWTTKQAQNQQQTHNRYRNIIDSEQFSNYREHDKIKNNEKIRTFIAVAVSVLTNYIDFRENFRFEKSLEMLQKRIFFDDILVNMRRLIIRSRSQAQKFVDQIIRICLFTRIEPQVVPIYDHTSKSEQDYMIQKNQRYSNAKFIDYLLHLIVDITEQMADTNACVPIVMSFIKAITKEMAQSSNIQCLILAKSINTNMVKNFKKIMIYIREKVEFQNDFEFIDGLKLLLEKTLAAIPNPMIYKEFFSFLREIFYYNKDMDQVDCQLAGDVLEILNNLMKNKGSDQIIEKKSKLSVQKFLMNDYFYISDYSPGIILTDNFKPPQDCFYLTMLFNIDMKMVRQQYEEKKTDSICLTLFTIKNVTDPFQDPLPIYVQTYQDNFKLFDFVEKIDDNWHLLIVQFKYKQHKLSSDEYKIKIFIDSVSRPIGLSVDMKYQKNSQYDKGMKIKSNEIFQGRLSFIFGFTKFNLDKNLNDNDMREGFKMFIFNQIQKKHIINLSPQDLTNFFKSRQIKHPKDFPKEFECLNDLNEQIILKHHAAIELNFITAIHAIRPHQTFVGLGGFKLMYPLFEKSLQSNLSKFQKSDIWKNLFKILRTLMNVEPGHVSRLFRNKNLIEILKYCLIRGGLQNILTRDLINYVIQLLSDIRTNDSNNELEGFYKRYLYDIILCPKFCFLNYTDSSRLRKEIKVFVEVADNLYAIFQDQYFKPSYKNSNIMRLLASEECYQLLMKLIQKFSSVQYIKQTNKIAKILIKIAITIGYKEGFMRLIDIIQKNHIDKVPLEKTTTNTLLKILLGIISDPMFTRSPLIQVFKMKSNIDLLDKHLVQLKPMNEYNQGELDKIRDSIIALTFKIEYDTFTKFNDSFRARLPPERAISSHQPRSLSQDDRNMFINRTFDQIKKNKEPMPMQKTVCTLLMISFEQAFRDMQKNQGSPHKIQIRYNPQSLIEIAKHRNFIDLINSKYFDKDIFNKVKELFYLFDFNTKSLFLNFFKQIIDVHDEISETGQMKFMMNILKLETNIKTIVEMTLKTEDQSIIDFSERIVSSVIKSYFDSSLDIQHLDQMNTHYSDEEKQYLKFIKMLMWSLDHKNFSQLVIINDALRHAQDVSLIIDDVKYNETNKVNFNIKLISILQMVEEIIFRKSKQDRLFLDEQFYQILARLLILFDERQIMYFDQPSPNILESERQSISLNLEGSEVENIRLDSKDTIKARDFEFILGGPLRIILSFLLQMMRKYQDNEHQFDWLMQMMRFLIFRDESDFINQFRVQTNTYHLTMNKNERKIPLFKLIFGSTEKIKNMNFKLTVYDLTRMYIEKQGEYLNQRETMTSCPGFIAFLLVSELYEIIRRKLIQEYNDQENLLKQRNLQSVILKLFDLLYQILKEYYQIKDLEGMDELSMGQLVLTILHPHLKENLFHQMRQPFLQSQDNHKIFFLSKPYHPEIIDYQELDDNMKDSYFRMKTRSPMHSEIQSNIEENNTVMKSQIVMEENTIKSVYENEEDQLFRRADLEKSDIETEIEQRQYLNAYNEVRPNEMFQDQVMEHFSKLYSQLNKIFDTVLPNSDPEQISQSVKQIKQVYFDSKPAMQLMQCIRQVSTEKFRESLQQIFSSYKSQNEIYNKIIKSDEEIDAYYQKHKMKVQRTPKLEPDRSWMTSQNANLGQSQNMLSSQRILNQSQNVHQKNDINIADSFTTSQIQDNFTQKLPIKRVESVDSLNTFEIYSDNGQVRGDSILKQGTGPGGKQDREHRTLQYYYTKYQYWKIVKRLEEDQSSMWYDNLEQIRKDYADLKEIYDLITAPKKNTHNNNNQEEFKSKSVINDPQRTPRTMQQANSKKRQYDHFVRQRRNADSWGRMFLLKPDRRYKQTNFWMTHMYFIHDFMKSMLAVGFLEDSDFSDAQTLINNLLMENAQRQVDEYNESLGNTQEAGTNLDFMNASLESFRQSPQSEQLKKLREMLINKIEQNDFLYSLMSNPDSIIDQIHDRHYKGPYDFHNIEYSLDQLEFDIQYIAVEGPYFGRFYISNQYIMFKSKCEPLDPEKFKFALHLDQQMRKKDKIWHYNEIEQIFKRRFLLVHQACEIFTKEKKSYFFNFFNEENCHLFFQRIKEIYQRNKYSKAEIITNPRDEFRKKEFKNKWLKGEISNQQFLLLVNKYSGRSFNDLTQYPIFPWVLKDQHSSSYSELKDKINNNPGEVLRDLTFTTGAITEFKRQNAINQYRKDEDAVQIYGNEKFHLKFGYSNKMFSLAYLIRLEPFTDSFIQVNKSLDNPDRIMYSIGDQYHSVETDPQNNSELTPEFFYLPEILRNHNLNHFGRNREGTCVNEVILPPWAKNEHDFVRINREVLDSKIITSKLPFWLDMIFGAKQAKEECYNIFYCYAYENYVGVKSNRDQMEVANIDTIKEFMQVPYQLFKDVLATEKTFKIIFGGQMVSGQVSGQLPSSQQIPQHQIDDMESLETNQTEFGKNKSKAEKGQSGLKKFFFKQPPQQVTSRVQTQNPASSSHQVIIGRNQPASSLIRRFLEKPKPKDSEINNICEEHKISDPNRQVIHMLLSLNKCLVFVSDRFQNEGFGNGYISVAGCRESFSQDELKPLCNLGIRIQNLKGDLSAVFQTTTPIKNTQKYPLIYIGQNLDNTIKVFDLNVKKGQPQLVYQESVNNNVVNVIKFSQDSKYFITGDQDGVIHHYCRDTEDIYDYQSSALASSAPMPKFDQKNPAFPYILKYKIQDHMAAVIGVDINMTLDMYATASSDGNIFLRCLRTSQLWKVIPASILQVPHIQVVSLKISLHGYVIIVIKTTHETHIYVYSINGDILTQQIKANNVFELKYVQLSQAEDHLIWVINRKNKNTDIEWNGQNSKNSISTRQNKPTMMPAIRCFTMNQDESKLNLFLANQLIYCFDESKEQIIKQLDDFGLT
ncbi:beach domain-containing protein [Stylonychia lemnae]|uniref:Beach domain-containing protein n=1 Tax=Stylonychia lemnae TaxID=5949 RepID=A0A077ZZB1_STYLE|nr:beach domain-containing protein [Stylonychia lemnae]|eukprot:CDW75265.1 beach domain-containing protein [Stylonychia lemnae]